MLLSKKVGSKTNIPGSEIDCHLTALLASTLEFIRCKTKQNSMVNGIDSAYDHIELCLVLQTEVILKEKLVFCFPRHSSNLTTSLVNISLKFAVQKLLSFFQQKISVYLVIKW